MKFGRLPRAHRLDVPHISLVRRALKFQALTIPPPAVDYTAGMTSFGMMCNNRLGCCTSAGLYHRLQVVSFHTNPPENTQPDAMVEKFYSLSTGYNSADPNSDQGGIEQDVLSYAVKSGIPLADGSADKLLTFIEIDPHNAIDIDWAIHDCLGVYIGFNVPEYLPQTLTAAGSVWDINAGADNTIVGGHCVYVPGKLVSGNRRCISWGATYDITPAFWNLRVDEAYALFSTDMVAANTGKTVLGMDIDEAVAAAQDWKMAV